MTKTMIQRILKRSEELRSELAKIASSLIKFRTVSPPSDTQECAEYVKAYFEERGLDARIYSREKGKANVHVRVEGSSGKTIIWLGHLDVVPEGRREEWIYDPFGGTIVGDRIYGRGASDMKGSCAAAMVAARILSEVGSEDRATVDFWFTCDEEVGSPNGTRWLLETGYIRGEACLIGDSLSRDPARKPYIDVGCKGYLRVRLRAFGKAAHASMPFYGENAISKLIAAVGFVERFKDYRLKVPAEIEGLIATSIEYLLSAEGLSEEQKSAIKGAYHHPTISLTIISGGIKTNVIPDYAEATFDIRITPGSSPIEIAEEIKKAVRESGLEGVDVEVTGLESGYYEAWDSSFAASLREAVKIATGVEPKPKILLGATDAIHVKRALNIPCLGFGAGIEEMAHAPNEYVRVDGLLAAAKVYATLPFIYR